MWHDLLLNKAGSDLKAARLLHRDWRKKASKQAAKTSERALGNWISRLHRDGDRTGWWRKRPVLCQLLADLIEVDVSSIFAAAAPAGSTTFLEFPALPALANHEIPCRTTADGSLYEQVQTLLEDTSCSWFTVPPGGGKTLTIELLRARSATEVSAVSVSRLSAALPRLQDEHERALVIEVDEADAASDQAALTALEAHAAGVVILAPFPCPSERSVNSFRASPRRRWQSVEWEPAAQWVSWLLEWVESRLEASPRDSKLDRAEIENWLKEHPEIRRVLRTPGELLALCADFDVYGADGTPEERARRWLELIGLRTLPAGAPAFWVRHAALPCLQALLETDAMDRASAWGERSFQDWGSLVPVTSQAGSRDGPVGAEMIVSYLREAGLLRSNTHGLTGYPCWMASAMVRPRVQVLLVAEDVAAWGVLASDRSRQGLVDDALDGSTLRQLADLAERVLQRWSALRAPPRLAELAALEALVAALGRRLARHAPAAEKLAGIALRALCVQLKHLVPAANEVRVPTTRHDRDAWFATGWAISLATPGAQVAVPADLRWTLPGWSVELRLEELRPLQAPWTSQEASETLRAVIALVPRALARVTRGPVPDEVPRFLLPGLLLSGWQLNGKHLQALSGSWEERFLVSSSRKLGTEQRGVLATQLWSLAGEAWQLPSRPSPDVRVPVAERLVYVNNAVPRLRRLIIEYLPVQSIEATAREAGTHRRQHPDDAAALRWLSPDHRAAAVRGWLSSAELRASFDEARDLLGVLDGDELDALLDVIRGANAEVAAEFASEAWRLVPERALEEARHALGAQLASARGWFLLAPRRYLGRLLALAQAAQPPPPWLREWGLRRATDGGIYGDALFALAAASEGDE